MYVSQIGVFSTGHNLIKLDQFCYRCCQSCTRTVSPKQLDYDGLTAISTQYLRSQPYQILTQSVCLVKTHLFMRITTHTHNKASRTDCLILGHTISFWDKLYKRTQGNRISVVEPQMYRKTRDTPVKCSQASPDAQISPHMIVKLKTHFGRFEG